MTERHFRVVQLANKKVEIGGVSITSKASPGSAARKLLTSIAHEKGLKKNKKVNMGKVTFSIQEYTQGSSKKVYGPYVGHFHKYTAAELKKAKTAGGKVKFTMKPVVKLAKKNMKGGNCVAIDGVGPHKIINNQDNLTDLGKNMLKISYNNNNNDNANLEPTFTAINNNVKNCYEDWRLIKNNNGHFIIYKSVARQYSTIYDLQAFFDSGKYQIISN